MPEPELEESFAELPSIRASADANTLDLQDFAECNANRPALSWCQLLPEPA